MSAVPSLRLGSDPGDVPSIWRALFQQARGLRLWTPCAAAHGRVPAGRGHTGALHGTFYFFPTEPLASRTLAGVLQGFAIKC